MNPKYDEEVELDIEVVRGVISDLEMTVNRMQEDTLLTQNLRRALVSLKALVCQLSLTTTKNSVDQIVGQLKDELVYVNSLVCNKGQV